MAEFNTELMKKVEAAASPEEILAIAKDNNIKLTQEQANAYFEKMHKTGELSDDELDNVAGGGCGNQTQEVTDPICCPICGSHSVKKYSTDSASCNCCGFCEYAGFFTEEYYNIFHSN